MENAIDGVSCESGDIQCFIVAAAVGVADIAMVCGMRIGESSSPSSVSTLQRACRTITHAWDNVRRIKPFNAFRGGSQTHWKPLNMRNGDTQSTALCAECENWVKLAQRKLIRKLYLCNQSLRALSQISGMTGVMASGRHDGQRNQMSVLYPHILALCKRERQLIVHHPDEVNLNSWYFILSFLFFTLPMLLTSFFSFTSCVEILCRLLWHLLLFATADTFRGTMTLRTKRNLSAHPLSVLVNTWIARLTNRSDGCLWRVVMQVITAH